jgi:hypothetical protein
VDPAHQGGGFALVVVVGGLVAASHTLPALRSRAHKPARRAASSRSPGRRIPALS